MQSENRFFDDIARVAGGAFNALAGVRGEIEAMVRQQFERLLADMNLVTRDEFEAVQGMAAKARSEQEALEKRVAGLEAALAGKTPPEAPKRTRAPRVAKAAAATPGVRRATRRRRGGGEGGPAAES